MAEMNSALIKQGCCEVADSVCVDAKSRQADRQPTEQLFEQNAPTVD
jgi:hypothetical protein